MSRGVGIAWAAACCLLPATGCAVLSLWGFGPMAWSAEGDFKGPLESAAPAAREALRLAGVTAAPEQDAEGLTLAGKTPAGQRVRIRLTRSGESPEGRTWVRIEWDELPDADLGVSLLKVMEDVALEAKDREAAAAEAAAQK